MTNNNTLDTLLSRLEAVRRTGESQWVARCPAHDDGTPSLAIRDASGVLLLHCFGGCSAADIVAAVGMELSDLFPPRESTNGRSISAPTIRAEDVLAMLHREVLIVLLASEDAKDALPLNPRDEARLDLAVSRIRSAAEYIGCTYPETVTDEAVDRAADALQADTWTD